MIKYRFLQLDPLFQDATDKDEYEQLTSLPSEETTPHISLTNQPSESCDDVDSEGPTTLKQQPSLDSESSGDSAKSVKCSYQIEDFLTPEQQAARKDVEMLLKELERAEHLFPTFKNMVDKFGVCQTPQFKRRRDALILWSKITENLASHLSWLSRWFCAPIIGVYTRQLSEEEAFPRSPMHQILISWSTHQ